MQHEVFDVVLPQFTQLLTAMKGYFTKAAQHAEIKKYDVNTLLTARLAPDQYSLAKQVHVTCFLAEECVGRAAGKVPPKYDAESTTVAELNRRIDHAVTYLKSFNRTDFKGWEERNIDIFFAPGKYLHGADYVQKMGIPNVFFHLTTVYSILRHNGIDVGKMDYLGPVTFLDK